MRVLKLLPLLLFGFWGSLVAQTTYYSNGGDWNQSTSWSTVAFGNGTNTGPAPSYPVAGDIVNIGGGFTITVTGNEACGSITFSSLTNNTLVIDGTNSLTVSGNLVGGGAVQTQISYTGGGLLRVGGTMFAPASGTINTVTGSRFEYIGTTQTVTALAYNDLILSGSGVKTLGATTTVGRNLTINATAFNVSGQSLTVNGTTTVNSGGSINFVTSATGTKLFAGLVTINSGGTWNNAINEGFTFQGGITNNGSGNWTGGTAGTYLFNTNTQTITGEVNAPTVTVTGGAIDLINNGTLTASVTLGGTGEIVQGAGATLTLGGTSTITGFTVTASGNTVNYTGAAQTVRAVNYQNLSLSGSGAKTLAVGTANIAGNFTIGGTATANAVVGLTIGGNVALNGGTFTGGAFTHTVGGNWLTNGGVFAAAGSALVFNRAGGQTIGGSAASNFDNVTLAGSGTKVFAQEMDATGTLNINSGVVADLGVLTTHSANRLRFAGASVPAGIWGSVASPANPPNESDVYFTSSSLGTIAIAAGGFTYYSRVTGVWSDANTWSTISFGGPASSGIPGAADEVFIGGGFTVTVSSAPAAAALLGFQDAGSTANSVVVNLGQTLSVGGSITIPRNGNSNTLAIGAGTVTAANLIFTTGTGSGVHQVTLTTGTLVVSGNITGIGTSSAITYSGNGLVRLGGTMFAAGSGLLTTVEDARFEYTGGSQTVQALGYEDLILSGSGTKTLAATTTLNGNLTINTTTFNVAGVSLSVAEGTTVNTGGTLAFVTSAAGTKTFTGLVTVNTGGTWNNVVNEGFTFQGGITNNGGIWNGGTAGTYLFNINSQTITGTVSAPTVTVTGAAIDLTNNGTFTASVALGGSGELVQGAGATLNLGGTSTITTFTAAAAGNTVNYTGAAQTVRGVNYQNLGLSGSGAKTLAVGTTSIAGNFTMSGTASTTAVVGITIGGNFVLGTGTSFTAGSFTHNIGGDFTNNGGTFVNTGSTIVLNGSIQSVGGTTTPAGFNNLTLAGSGTKTFNVSATVVATLSINSGAQGNLNTFTHTANALRLGGGPVVAGRWGSTAAVFPPPPPDNFTNDTFFAVAGTGYITVATGAFTYYSRATGDWNNTATWSTVGHGSATNLGTFPGSTDESFIGGGFTVTVTANQSTGAITFDETVPNTNQLQLDPGVTLAVTNSITLPRNGGSNTLAVGAGSVTAASVNFTNGTGAGSHTVSLSTGTLTVSGNITGIGASSTISYSGNGLVQVGGAMFASGSGTLSTVAGSRFEYNGGAQTIQALSYRDLILSGSGTKTFTTTATLVSGALSVNAVTVNVPGLSLTVSGTTTVNSGGTLAFVTSAAGTKLFTGLVTINSGGTWNNVINEGFTFQGGITNNGTFTAGTAGTYLFNTSSQPLTGTFILPSVTVTGAAVALTNNNTLTVNTALAGTGRITQAATATLNIAGTSTITNMTASTVGNTVNYTGGAQTINSVNFFNLGLSGSGLKSFQAGTTAVGGNFSIGGTASATAAAGITFGGAITIGTGTTFTAGSFTHQVAGNWTNDGTFVALGSTVVLNGTAQAIGGVADPANFENLTAAGSGIKSFTTRVIANGALSINSGVQLDLGGFTNASNVLILSGVTQPLGTYTSGTTPTFFLGTGSINVGLLVFYSKAAGNWNVAANWSNAGHGGPDAPRAPDVGDVVVIGQGNSITIDGARSCASLLFDGSVSATNSLTVPTGTSLTVTGTVSIPRNTVSGANTLAVSDGIVTAGNIDFPSGGTGVHEVTIGSTSSRLTVLGNITAGTSSATIRYTGSGLVQVAGTMFSSGTLNTTAGGRFEYNGGSQVVQNLTYRDLIISESGTKTLGAAISMTGNLSVRDNAALNISAFAFTVSGTASIGEGVSGLLAILPGTVGAKTFVGLVTINPGATWNNTANAGVVFRGGITNAAGGTFNAGTGVQTFNTAAAQTLTGVLSIPSLTVTSPTVLTNNSTNLTVATALSGTGQLLQDVNAVLNIGGTSGITTLNATASGNTVNYTGAGAQTVRAVNYFNLGLSGAGTKALAGAGTIGVAGSWNNSGSTVTPSTSTVVFNGSADQTITTNGQPFNNVTTSKSAGTVVNLSGATTVNGALTLNVGNFVIGNNTLTLNGTFSGANAVDRCLVGSANSNLVVTGTGSLGTLFFSAAGNSINSLQLNRSTLGAATLGNTLTVNSTLTLTNGTLTNGTFLTLASNALLSRTNDGTLTNAPVGGFYNLEYTDGTLSSYSTGIELVFASVNDIANNVSGTLTLSGSFVLRGTLSFGPTASFNTGPGIFVVNSVSDVADFSNPLDANGRIGQIQGGSVIGEVTVERFMGDDPGPSVNRYLASPVSGQTLADLVATFSWVNNRAQRYDENVMGTSSLGWRNVRLTDNLDPGRGYLLFPTPEFANSNLIWEVTGPLNAGQNQGSVNFATVATGNLSYTPSTPTALPNDDGFNLLGNPYPSPIVWSNNPAQWTSDRVSSFIYVQDVAGGLKTYDYSTSIFNTLPNGVIAMGQAFWVKATAASPVLTVHEAAKTGLSGEFFKTNHQPDSFSGMSVIMSQGNVEDHSWLLIDPSSKIGLDGNDRPKLHGEKLGVYFSVEGRKMICSSVDRLPVEDIPLVVFTGSTGEFVLNFQMVGSWGEYENLYLVDKVRQISQKISEQPIYSFTGLHGMTYSERFFLTTRPENVQFEKEQLLQVFPNPSQGQVQILLSTEDQGHVSVFNLAGQVVLSTLVSETDFFTLDLSGIESGVYLIRFAGQKGVSTNKIVKN